MNKIKNYVSYDTALQLFAADNAELEGERRPGDPDYPYKKKEPKTKKKPRKKVKT